MFISQLTITHLKTIVTNISAEQIDSRQAH